MSVSGRSGDTSMIFRQRELADDRGDQHWRSVERERPRTGRKVMNEGSGGQALSRDEESWRGARGGLGGSSPPLFLGSGWGLMTP